MRFLVEIPVPHSDAAGLARAARTLWTADLRSSGDVTTARLESVSVVEAGRLVCVIEASTIEAVRSLVALAFLSTGRIREAAASEISGLVDATPRGGGHDPRRDLRPGVEPQLVQDVVDVGLDRALGDE